MTDQDSFQRFIFDQLGIRGAWVRLNASWLNVQANKEYPLPIASQLGQALAAVTLISGSIKFDGSLILQTHSDGPLNTLVAQATHQRNIRGLAHWNDQPIKGNTLPEIYGPGKLVLTLKNQDHEPHQGIVALDGVNLASALEDYFTFSEQLETKLWLFADQQQASGFFIQKMPEPNEDPDGWNRICLLSETIKETELQNLPCEALLYRLFHEEVIRLFEAEPVVFRCACSRERIENLLLSSYSLDEMDEILTEKNNVEVDCEFCNRHYSFDAIDIHALFSAGQASPRALQ